tara:strand:+ start:17699 stop:17905 length:207 start_codon:yes stop_codon:yes gene_type:complete
MGAEGIVAISITLGGGVDGVETGNAADGVGRKETVIIAAGIGSEGITSEFDRQIEQAEPPVHVGALTR